MSIKYGLLLGLLALFAGCRDSPDEVIGSASEAAAEGRIVDVQGAFSVDTRLRLKVAWGGQTEDPVKWNTLASRLLTRDRKPLVIKSEEIFDDYAMVIAMANVNERRYYLKKDDGQWRIELGGGLGFRRAKKRVTAADIEKEKRAKRKEEAQKAKGE
ncbi:MAG: hypothetical protein ACI9U2_003031 [Bradymonadia bacterium]